MAENKKTLAESSNENLQVLKNKYKNRLFIQFFLILVTIVASVFITLKKGFNFFTIAPVIFAAPIIQTTKIYYELNQEIKSRNM